MYFEVERGKFGLRKELVRISCGDVCIRQERGRTFHFLPNPENTKSPPNHFLSTSHLTSRHHPIEDIKLHSKMPRNVRANRRATLELETLQEANQAMSTKIEMLEQQNQILKKNFNTIRDSLLNATGLSLGRMIIEAGLAVNELRDSMPSDPEPNEADLEEGELPDPEISFWKKRLDKMIKRISEAHSKSKEETKEIADTMTSMAEELQRLVDGHPAVRRSKRLRDVEEVDYAGEDGLDDEEDMEYSIERKRARYEENRQGFESQQFRPSMAFAQPDVSSKIPFSPLELESDEKNLVPVRTAPMEGIPLWVAQQNQTPISTPVLPAAPERLPLRDINPNVNAGSMGMHADRQKMLENIKVEEDVDVSTVVGPVVPVSLPETESLLQRFNV